MAAPSGALRIIMQSLPALRADLGAHVPAAWPLSARYNGSVDSSEEWGLIVAWERRDARAVRPRPREAVVAFQYSGSQDKSLARTLCNYPDKPVLLSR